MSKDIASRPVVSDDDGVTRWRRWAVALITLAAGATTIIVALRSPGGLESATKVGALIVGLVPLTVGLVVWARRRPPTVAATSTVEQVDAAQRELAEQVLSQWRNEIAVRQLDDPGPLAVRWRFTELDVVDRTEHGTHQNPLRSLISRGRHRFTGRTDRIDEFAKEYRKLTQRRLVILGDPGMGKTTLALLLVRELLAHADPCDPVPVLFSMSDWNPVTESLDAWLTRRLAADYPVLRAAVFGPDAPRSLVTRRRILPVLDGLDELPEVIQPKVLARLNETAGEPLVLTCRTTEYQTAVAAHRGDVLTGGAVIEPSPLTPSDAARYITNCLPPRTGGGWRDLLTALRREPNSAIAKALSTPLALWLLRKVYIEPCTNPHELCDTSRFPTPSTIIDHLLDHLIEALIAGNPPRDNDSDHPFRPVRAWDPTDAERWLAFLAQHLNTTGTRDFAWWRLHRTTTRSVATAAGLVAGLAMGLAAGLHDWLMYGLDAGLASGPALGIVFGLAVGFAAGLTVWHVVGLIVGLHVLAAGLGAGLSAGEPALGVAFGLAGGAPIVLVVVMAIKGIGFMPATGPAYADLRLRGRMRSLTRTLTNWTDGRLVFRFMPGFTIGFAYTLIAYIAGGSPDTPVPGPVLGLVSGLVFGAAAWLAIGLTEWAATPVTNERPQTPMITFRRDRQLIYIKALTTGCTLGIAFGIQDTLTGSSEGLTTGLTVAFITALAITLGVGLHQSSGRYLATTSILCAQRRIPLRLLSFLDDAYRLGILRQVGSTYQFRHAKLQDRLARSGN